MAYETTWKNAQAIVGTSPGRPEGDFYPTPEHVTWALLHREHFHKNVWECACGNGVMSEVLKEDGYNVYSTDLYDRGYGIPNHDFLNMDVGYTKSIITNPPFKLAVDFMEHALDIGCGKLALFCKLAFLEGYNRTEKLMVSPLKRVWVFRKRVLLTRNGEKPRGSGMIAFAWYVWERGYDGEPTIGWI